MIKIIQNFYSRGEGRRIDWLIEVAFILASFFLYFSFLDSGKWDNSWQVASDVSQNITGNFGAWSSNFFVFLFGKSAIFIPFFLFRIAFLENRLKSFYFFIFFMISTIISLSLFFQLFDPTTFIGGFLGYSFSSSLSVILESFGIGFVSFFVILGGFILSFFLFLKSFNFTFKDIAFAEQKIIFLIKKLYNLILKYANSSKKKHQQFMVKSPSKIISKKIIQQKTLPIQDAKKSFILPPISLLQEPKKYENNNSKTMLMQNAKMLEHFFAEFKVQGKIRNFHPGPVVTLYEFEPESGTKTSKIVSLAGDVARSMSMDTLRISPISGTNRIGIELPNFKREIVFLKKSISHDDFNKVSFHLPIILGDDISGENVVVPLEKMPHLLVAGRTGSGKSVFIRTIILSLLYKQKPEDCRLILIDPKMLEFKDWEDIPHLLTPVVTNPNEAVNTLKWAVREMESRYKKMALLKVKNLEGYNKKVNQIIADKKVVKHKIKIGIDSITGKPQFESRPIKLKPYPFLVIIIDELADLMLVAGKEVEASIQRLAQMARASGIHLIMATQRPSVNVITGVIKANFPTRISFQVSSKIDSRTILERQGAEQLLDHGDMLYMAAGRNPVRVHAPFATEKEAQTVANFLKAQAKPDYVHNVVDEQTDQPPSVLDKAQKGKASEEELYEKAVQIVLETGKVSISFVQRQLRIGYNKSANLIEMMEKRGVISTAGTNGKRVILKEQLNN